MTSEEARTLAAMSRAVRLLTGATPELTITRSSECDDGDVIWRADTTSMKIGSGASGPTALLAMSGLMHNACESLERQMDGRSVIAVLDAVAELRK